MESFCKAGAINGRTTEILLAWASLNSYFGAEIINDKVENSMIEMISVGGIHKVDEYLLEEIQNQLVWNDYNLPIAY